MTRDEILTAPIPRTLFTLAWPVLVVLAMQTFVGIAETWFVSRLGTGAVAGVALVFPLFMLMAMMSNGGIGGGVSSAIARALGSARKADADALVVHALVIAVVFGALFSVAAWVFGPPLYRWLGADEETLRYALLYSNVTFGAAIPAWITNILASSLRGSGSVRVPAGISIVGAIGTLVVSPLLIFGWGAIPGFGVAGAGMAMILFMTVAAALLASFLRSGVAPVRLHAATLEWRLFREILRVGLPSALGTVVANLTVVVTTGFVTHFGRDALAGYGLASRIDYLLIPLLFAIGTAAVTMVGTNFGAGKVERARLIAWNAAVVSMAITGMVGLFAAAWPDAWMHLFTTDRDVVLVGRGYLGRVAPFYCFVGLGMALYFSCQGVGRVMFPFTVGVARLGFVVVNAAWFIAYRNGSLMQLFWIVAVSQVLFGGLNAAGMLTGLSWGIPIPKPTTRSAAEPEPEFERLSARPAPPPSMIPSEESGVIDDELEEQMEAASRLQRPE